MKIFRMLPSIDCPRFSFEVFPGRDDLGNAMFADDLLLPRWKPLEADMCLNGNPSEYDIVSTGWTYAGFALSVRAAQILRPHLDSTCELLPFEYQGSPWFFLYVRGCPNCLDPQRTIFNPSGNGPRDVFVAAFVPERLPGQRLFRITRGNDYYVMEEMKKVIEEAKLKGVFFQFMWSDAPSRRKRSGKTAPRQTRLKHARGDARGRSTPVRFTTPRQSKARFLKRLKAAGITLSGMTGEKAVSSMLDFYLQEEAKGCPLDSGGDMLLFQWGLYESDEGKERFVFDITRQFIFPPGEDENIWQLSLALHYPVTDETRKVKEGNIWCESPDQVDQFAKLIRRSPAYKLVAKSTPSSVLLSYGCAG